jgi:hypothetical protein
VEIVATIDVNRDEMGAEMTIENWDEQVKIQCAAFFDDPIYIDRADLIQLLVALDVASV